MKKMLPNMIFWLFIVLVLLWSVYYIISMTDFCGISVGKHYSDEKIKQLLPDGSAATYGSFHYENCYFQNRFGNIVFVHRDGELGVTEVKCYDKRFASNSWLGLLQIRPGMDIGEIISKVGLPISFGGSGIERAYVELNTGELVMVFLDNVRGKYNLVSGGNFQIWSDTGETEIFQIGGWLYPGVVLTVGLLTLFIVFLRLKKKGILCKKKQSTE